MSESILPIRRINGFICGLYEMTHSFSSYHPSFILLPKCHLNKKCTIFLRQRCIVMVTFDIWFHSTRLSFLRSKCLKNDIKDVVLIILDEFETLLVRIFNSTQCPGTNLFSIEQTKTGLVSDL